MRSMTGFGAGVADLPATSTTRAGRVQVELRSVNHRFLDVRVRAGRDLADFGALLEQACRERFARGRIDVAVRVEGGVIAPGLDRERARAAWAELVALRDELDPKADVPLSLLGTVPDLFAFGAGTGGLEAATLHAFAAAADALDEARTREGAELAADLRRHAAEADALVAAISAREPEARAAQRKRLLARAERWKADVALDPARLEQEIVLLLERCDVSEELSRLGAHLRELEVTVSDAAGVAPVGRKLDFFLQEMAREANTLGAKAQDATMAHAVVALKTEIERMREQVQNVE